ncbi:MAG: nickel-dependent hydrogenase large subunit [Motiliproteus sp.]
MKDSDIADILTDLALEWEQSGQIISTPQWQQQALETGAWSYHQHHALIKSLREAHYDPMLIRLVARISDLVELLALLAKRTQPGIGRSGAMSRGNGIGLGWVKTARGLLVHHIMVENDAVRQYRIIAPTEWNFHPQGALRCALTNWREWAPSQLRGWVDLQVLGLDPCVQYQVEIEHA